MSKSIGFSQKLKNLWHVFLNTLFFIVLVILYSFSLLLRRIGRKNKFLNGLAIKNTRFVNSLDRSDTSGVSQLYLMEIAFKNMAAKKTRTIVTVGGMAIGISFIVFLVSIGYGLQQVVVARVARLDELKQAEVVPGLSVDLALTDATINKFKEIKNVENVLPLIAVIGRVSYQNSVSDLAVYGATRDYLKYSALQPTKGTLFESNSITLDVNKIKSNPENEGTAKHGEKIKDVAINIESGTWLKVRENPETKAKIIGYTKRVEGRTSGEEYWGDTYADDNKAGVTGKNSEGTVLGKWVKSEFLLWEKKSCSVEEDSECEEGQYVVLRDKDNSQLQETGYVAEIGMTVTDNNQSTKVLGVNTTADNGSLPVVELASESAGVADQQVEKVSIDSREKKEIVVNQSVLQLLSIDENNAIGKELSLSLVVVGELLEDPNVRIESAPLNYKIVGVIPDEGTPIIYVPFRDVRSLGVNKYSQLKVIAKDNGSLRDIRTTIESAGYGTVSVSDTVAQIDSLFSNFRLVLSILGLVALSVAALGMFNTLTVSLLERTREVGLMKAMGLKSGEVKSLFLTESMIMGLYGGILGLLLGIGFGKLLSLILSALSVVKGVGFVDVSYVPISFVVFVIFLSILVGIATGYYPAKRATKISALNALRYE
ncbi:MAG: FtsX-like permease family protein [Acidobacteria bacterium]|nr:FtsX-like permease family protein [Acidobacteriota bacterium]